MQYAIINDLEFLNRHVLNSVSLSEGYDVDQVVYQGPEFCLYVTEIENINPNYIDEAVGCGNMTIFNSDSKIDLIQAINDGSFTIT